VTPTPGTILRLDIDVKTKNLPVKNKFFKVCPNSLFYLFPASGSFKTYKSGQPSSRSWLICHHYPLCIEKRADEYVFKLADQRLADLERFTSSSLSKHLKKAPVYRRKK
jgi:hypothetical protein